MNYKNITIVSEFNGSVQAWNFQIEESDLIAIMEKYENEGCSVLGDANDIAEEIKETYK